MLKRIGLFLLTNILVMVTITFVLNLLGVGHYITEQGLNYKDLAIFCLVWGMAGSFISLAMSRMMAKWTLGVKVINPQSAGEYAGLVQTIHQFARQANLPAMPEVGIYESPEVNAFATGPTKSRSLVAVSSGLLRSMNAEQINGVLAHEITHIQNGDMVTMTLLQGVVNAFVLFLAKIAAFAISQNVKEESRYMVRFMVEIVLQIGLSALGMLVIAAFSRQREFRADAGGAKIAGRSSMTSALKALQARYSPAIVEEAHRAPALAAFKISGSKSWMSLFSTHPPLEVRIARLESMRSV